MKSDNASPAVVAEDSEELAVTGGSDDDGSGGGDGSSSSSRFESSSSAAAGCDCGALHLLRRNWRFWVRQRDTKQRKGQSGTDWQQTIVKQNCCVDSVESFWNQLDRMLPGIIASSQFSTPFGASDASNIYMFLEGVQPAWEDPKFLNGGSVNFTFSGAGYHENARYAYATFCAMLVAEQATDCQEIALGCALGPKASSSRVEIWVGADDFNSLSTVHQASIAALRQLQPTFFKNLATRVLVEHKVFRGGGAGRGGGKHDETTLDKLLLAGRSTTSNGNGGPSVGFNRTLPVL